MVTAHQPGIEPESQRKAALDVTTRPIQLVLASFINRWIGAMSRMTKLDIHNHCIRDEQLKKWLGIESLSEILDHRRMNWMMRVAKIPATLDDNQLQHKLPWCFGGKRQQGVQLRTLSKSYLGLLRKLQQLDSNN